MERIPFLDWREPKIVSSALLLAVAVAVVVGR